MLLTDDQGHVYRGTPLEIVQKLWSRYGNVYDHTLDEFLESASQAAYARTGCRLKTVDGTDDEKAQQFISELLRVNVLTMPISA